MAQCKSAVIFQNKLGSFIRTCKSGCYGNGFTCVCRLLASLLVCGFNETIGNLCEVN